MHSKYGTFASAVNVFLLCQSCVRVIYWFIALYLIDRCKLFSTLFVREVHSLFLGWKLTEGPTVSPFVINFILLNKGRFAGLSTCSRLIFTLIFYTYYVIEAPLSSQRARRRLVVYGNDARCVSAARTKQYVCDALLLMLFIALESYEIQLRGTLTVRGALSSIVGIVLPQWSKLLRPQEGAIFVIGV